MKGLSTFSRWSKSGGGCREYGYSGTLSILLATGLAALLAGCTSQAPNAVRAAVASNFQGAFEELAALYTSQSGVAVEASYGSTGKLAAQLRNGAHFDVFLAADVVHPEALIKEGLAEAGTRLRYASGKLALYAAQKLPPEEILRVLENGQYQHLAIAKPALAPYGAAAQEVLERLGLWDTAQPKLVFGENITQAYQFVRSGSAELDFVALSQVIREDAAAYWEVPVELHAPITQEAVAMKGTQRGGAFLSFLSSEGAREVITRHGYKVD